MTIQLTLKGGVANGRTIGIPGTPGCALQPIATFTLAEWSNEASAFICSEYDATTGEWIRDIDLDSEHDDERIPTPAETESSLQAIEKMVRDDTSRIAELEANRWAAFTDDELLDLQATLASQLGEAPPAPDDVITDRLLNEISAEYHRRR